MKKALRMIAALLVIGSVAFWMGAGANRGWTRTNIPKSITDETTGIVGIQWQRRFVPGVDFLGLAGLGAAALAGGSFLFRKNQKQPTVPTQP